MPEDKNRYPSKYRLFDAHTAAAAEQRHGSGLKPNRWLMFEQESCDLIIGTISSAEPLTRVTTDLRWRDLLFILEDISNDFSVYVVHMSFSPFWRDADYLYVTFRNRWIKDVVLWLNTSITLPVGLGFFCGDS
ncbi:hypothetical protein NPIL_361331 [Nephila pilipes]|uniref:Uncharacterized protein n=1 Tax=Nephila pilipes TaxID=299642 RepID=A0A8X6TL16_NEPPI|nr:hypothetical protein NPIL_361331 [Nephila pilipes]